MSFANPIFLFALAGAAAVPVIIHLLTRDRVLHVAFSTLRFFAKGAKLMVRRKKFQEILLLLLRVGLLALLALAFARPFFGAAAAGLRHDFATARVLVLDVSGSMRRPGLPEALKRAAVAAAGSLADGRDAAAIVTFADAPSVQLPLTGDLGSVRSAAAAAAPGYGSTNIADALRQANELLRGVRAQQKEIVLVSDLQRGGWTGFKGDWKLGAGVTLTVDAVQPDAPAGGASGLGIVDLSAPDSLVLDKQPSSLAVRVANFTGREQNGVDVALLLDGKKVDAQKINVRADGKVPVRFRHVFDTPGDNPGSIVVGSDAEPKNQAVVYFNARTLPRIPVLLIDGRPSTDPQTDAAFFLDKALAPTDTSPFAVSTVPADRVGAAEVAAADVVVLANVGRIPPAAADALGALLDRGGGLFFLPGDQASAEAFNAEFGQVAPCKLRQVLQARPNGGEAEEALTHINYDHPIFAVFSPPHHGDLSLPKFARYWETTDTQLSQVLARFGDDRPALLERRIGRGVSVAFVSAIDGEWNNFARQSVFLPFVHQTVRYLAVQTGRQTTYTCGDLLPVAAGETLRGPRGQALAPVPTGPGKEGVFAAEPGLYRVLDPRGQASFCYAVNGSLAESDPATVSAEQITAAIQRAPEGAFASLDAADAPGTDAAGHGTGLWWYLLAGIVLLSIVELFVANRTLRA